MSLKIRGEQIESSYPLSPMQQGMFLHSVYSQQSGLYIQQMVGRFCEELNVPAFERAWQKVVQSHAGLRTNLSWEDLAEPLQEVRRQVRMPIEESDWCGFAGDEQEARLNTYLRLDRERGFVLTEAPLMRLFLARVAKYEYWLVWTS